MKEQNAFAQSSLYHISLAGNPIKSTGVQAFIDALVVEQSRPYFPLKKLDLTETCNFNNSPDLFHNINKLLCSAKLHVSHLSLSSNMLQDSVPRLATCLTDQLCNLTHLNLAECSISLSNFEILCSELEKNTTLHYLCLSGNVGLNGQAIGKVLQSPNTRLKKLYMAGCRMTLEDISDILSSLCHNAQLTHLDLSDNHLPTNCAPSLLNLIPHLSNIQFLDLSGNGFNKEEVRNLFSIWQKEHITHKTELQFCGRTFKMIDTLDSRLASKNSQ